MSETTIAGTVQRGDKGADVRRVQEWLSLRGHGVQLDGIFGAATEKALKNFQKAHQLEVDGIAGAAVFAALSAPIGAVLRPLPAQGRSLGDLTVAYAEQHLAQHPREVGGANRGPWVRLYMNGNDGAEWLWCAGFVSFVLKQAATALKIDAPLKTSFSCDRLALEAQAKKLFLDGDIEADRQKLRPGSLFLERRRTGDWKHVGIVTSVGTDTFTTIEGNTNDEGSRNGYEVAANTRAFIARDFVLV